MPSSPSPPTVPPRHLPVRWGGLCPAAARRLRRGLRPRLPHKAQPAASGSRMFKGGLGPRSPALPHLPRAPGSELAPCHGSFKGAVHSWFCPGSHGPRAVSAPCHRPAWPGNPLPGGIQPPVPRKLQTGQHLPWSHRACWYQPIQGYWASLSKQLRVSPIQDIAGPTSAFAPPNSCYPSGAQAGQTGGPGGGGHPQK